MQRRIPTDGRISLFLLDYATAFGRWSAGTCERKRCRNGQSMRAGSLADHDATFHNEAHMFHYADVVERVARHSYDVRVVARLQFADLALPHQQLRAVDQVRLQYCQWAHSELDHQRELMSLCAMWERPDI